MKYKNLLTLVLVVFYTLTINAQKTHKSVLLKATAAFFEISNTKEVPNQYLVIDSEKATKYIFNFKNGGWIIAADEASTFKILGFSEKGSFTLENNAWYSKESSSIVDVDEVLKNEILANVNFKLVSTKDTDDYIAPFLTDTWGGVNCYSEDGSNVYPTNYYTPTHCSPGCVAIATAQILNYYEWPYKGVGSNVYYDEYNETPLRHASFFDATHYDWNNMLDEYMDIDSTEEEQQAVGELMYHVGIAIEMNYELTGSTNNLNNVPFALENFFRFGGDYHTESWSSFWSKLFESIQQHRPVPIAIENSLNDEGHVMVANGYKVLSGSPYYHLNWGWYDLAPTNNGWYNIEGWEVGDDGYDIILGAIFDMLPEPYINTIEPTGSGDDFTVNWIVGNNLNWDEFTLEQKIDDSSDWEVVASGITDKFHTISSPTGNIYQFRVKAKVDGEYYDNSWSEKEVYAVTDWYNGYGSFEGEQYAYAKQTPENALDFSDDYTFETWIRVHPENDNNNVIFDQKDVFNLSLENVSVLDYDIVFTSDSGGNLHSNLGGSAIPYDEWHHVAISKTGSNAKLYIDGELKDSGSSGFGLPTSNNYFNIGEKYHGGYSSWIVADFDQIRLSTTGRYSSDFTPTQDDQFDIDEQTTAYLTFQDVHRVRLKDDATGLSFVVKNQASFVNWKFEENTGSLSAEEIVFIESIHVFPNPTTDFIQVNFVENESFKLEDLIFSIYDNIGKLVSASNLSLKNNTIDLSQLAEGTYFLNVKGNGINATQTIIKN